MEINPDTTQKEMAAIIHAAPSMVNIYLKAYEEKHYIVREYLSPKKVKYRITPEGLKRKNYLLITYLHELLKLYKLAEDKVEAFLVHLEEKGYRRILLYGAGEVAETILGIIKSREDSLLEVMGIIEDDKKKWQQELLGFKIISREAIDQYQHDAVVITSYTFEDEIIEKLADIDYPADRVVRFFSGEESA